MPQDGSGVTRAEQILVTSAAVEETVPDVQAARRLGVPVMRRAGAAGPAVQRRAAEHRRRRHQRQVDHHRHDRLDPASRGPRPDHHERRGDEELRHAGDPVRQRGGRRRRCLRQRGRRKRRLDRPVQSAASPCVNNISLDHKTMEELRALFGDFVAQGRGRGAQSRQRGDQGARGIATARAPIDLQPRRSAARICLRDDLAPSPEGIDFEVDRARHRRSRPRCICRCRARTTSPTRSRRCARRAPAGCRCARRPRRSSGFSGIKRRFERVGTANGVTVIDDFAHNPDKIAATLDDAARLPRPPAGDVPAARLPPADADEERVDRLLRREPEPGRRAGDAGAGLLRRHHRPRR